MSRTLIPAEWGPVLPLGEGDLPWRSPRAQSLSELRWPLLGCSFAGSASGVCRTRDACRSCVAIARRRIAGDARFPADYESRHRRSRRRRRDVLAPAVCAHPNRRRRQHSIRSNRDRARPYVGRECRGLQPDRRGPMHHRMCAAGDAVSAIDGRPSHPRPGPRRVGQSRAVHDLALVDGEDGEELAVHQ
jgi:hypothetical protein